MKACNICGSASYNIEFQVEREDRFKSCLPGVSKPACYRQCQCCEAFYYSGDVSFERIYHDGAYYLADRLGSKEMAQRLDFILSLPRERSDNLARVSRIKDYLAVSMGDSQPQNKGSVLDVGAGLGVFLNLFLRDLDWQATAVEPDPTACALIRERLPMVEVLNGYWTDGVTLSLFDLVTLNRVLEHVENPIELLRSLRMALKPTGILYLELPSVDSFYKDGPNNEAFGYGHYTIYSKRSLEILAERSGYTVCETQLVQEPSGKFTIYSFSSR